MKNSSNQQCSLFIFTNDLRVEDHVLLKSACEESQQILFLYCLESWQFSSEWLDGSLMGLSRFTFLLESLDALNQTLENNHHRLLVRMGHMTTVIKELNQQHQFSHIYHSHSAGYYEQYNLRYLSKMLTETKFVTNHCQTLFSSSQLPFEVKDLPQHFTPFRKQVESASLSEVSEIPTAWPASIDVSEDGDLKRLVDYLKGRKTTGVVSNFKGGHTQALRHLEKYMSSSAPSSYKETRNHMMGWHHSTKFSPWLALGCVSPKLVVQRLQAYENKYGANDSTYWIYFELLWREFFYWHAIKVGSGLFQSNTDDRQSARQAKHFKAWCMGQTGEPLIDASMKELNLTGYMSNRARQIVASYLINEAGVDWRYGASYFERHLIDYDVASNWGNWQYIAGVGTDPRGGRRFNISKQQQTHDPNGNYIKYWSDLDENSSLINARLWFNSD